MRVFGFLIYFLSIWTLYFLTLGLPTRLKLMRAYWPNRFILQLKLLTKAPFTFQNFGDFLSFTFINLFTCLVFFSLR